MEIDPTRAVRQDPPSLSPMAVRVPPKPLAAPTTKAQTSTPSALARIGSAFQDMAEGLATDVLSLVREISKGILGFARAVVRDFLGAAANGIARWVKRTWDSLVPESNDPRAPSGQGTSAMAPKGFAKNSTQRS